MRVLVVEDDVLQRMNAVEQLTDAGYTVDNVDNADAAVTTIESGWDGRVGDRRAYARLHERVSTTQTICKRWPAIGVVIVSGLLRPNDKDLPDDSRFLAKPYDMNRLTDLVEEVAASHG